MRYKLLDPKEGMNCAIVRVDLAGSFRGIYPLFYTVSWNGSQTTIEELGLYFDGHYSLFAKKPLVKCSMMMVSFDDHTMFIRGEFAENRLEFEYDAFEAESENWTRIQRTITVRRGNRK